MIERHVPWLKHHIGMVSGKKFAEMFEDIGLAEGSVAQHIFMQIFEDVANKGGLFGKTSTEAHSKATMRMKFPLVYPYGGDDKIQWGIDMLLKYDLLTVDALGVYAIKNFEKYQHETLSTHRVQKHREDKKRQGDIDEVINFLNTTKRMLGFTTGIGYKLKNSSTRAAVNARFEDGYTMEDFKKTIVHRCKLWQHDKKMVEFLTPATLFRPANFDKYLAAVPQNYGYDVKEQDLVFVRDPNGRKSTITRDKFEKAESGYYTEIPK